MVENSAHSFDPAERLLREKANELLEAASKIVVDGDFLGEQAYDACFVGDYDSMEVKSSDWDEGTYLHLHTTIQTLHYINVLTNIYFTGSM